MDGKNHPAQQRPLSLAQGESMNDKPELLDLILRVFNIFNGFSGPDCDELWWRVDDEYSPVTLLVNCNDLFYWGCADSEMITHDNIHLLEDAATKIKEINPDREYKDAGALFCCLVRKMRPQKVQYKYMPERLRALFDACGPERE